MIFPLSNALTVPLIWVMANTSSTSHTRTRATATYFQITNRVKNLKLLTRFWFEILFKLSQISPGVRFLAFVSRLGYTAIADSRVLCLPFEFISIPIYFSLLTTNFTWNQELLVVDNESCADVSGIVCFYLYPRLKSPRLASPVYCSVRLAITQLVMPVMQ